MPDPTEPSASRLLLFSGQQQLAAFPVGTGPLLVGRATTCDIVLHSPYISQHHARLWHARGSGGLKT
ncbi:MAG: FHA domain-containing protein [Chloroflexaceae bacterium]|nr:FHA domain-containing protein [Chloroflexaceae bacterium]